MLCLCVCCVRESEVVVFVGCLCVVFVWFLQVPLLKLCSVLMHVSVV